MTYPNGRPARTGPHMPSMADRANWQLQRQRDPYGYWRAQHMPELMAIVKWAETSPAERVWPPKAEPRNG